MNEIIFLVPELPEGGFEAHAPGKSIFTEADNLKELPRNVSGKELAKALSKAGYEITRQTGSQMRLTCHEPHKHHIAIPAHNPLRVGTLCSIISDIANHYSISREKLIEKLF